MNKPLGSFLLLAIAISTASPVFAQRDKDRLAEAPSKFAKLDDIKIHYKALGKGDTTLVLVHGWSCNLSFWKEQIGDLEKKVQLVLIDLPGHGKSDRPKI